MYIETLVHGNMDVSAATELQAVVERVLGAQPLSAPEKLGDRSLLLPEGEFVRTAEARANPH